MNIRTLTPILLLAAATQVGATDCGQVLRDPGFDLWCGEQLCTWELVRGEIRRAPTWHKRDAGVELAGLDTAISQLAPVNDSDGTCIRFELVANVDEDAEVYLEIDVFGDGTIDRKERLPTARWELLSYNLAFKVPFDGIRFELSKKGSGSAVLGRIHAEIEKDGCAGLPEIDGGPAPLGARCGDDDDCASGLCRLAPQPGSVFGVAQVCVACDPELGAAACGAGEVCGAGQPLSPVRFVPIECVAAAGDLLGEQCISDAECESDRCTTFACSTCANGCAGGESCATAWPGGPWVCSPGGRRRATGEPCAADEDCASGACNGGKHRACTDGRPCARDAECPVEDGLVPGVCTTVGITGGTCR